mmetsp:Transcript_3077/g.11027  ORF Transcript_3077/g.11027 Transcript_3077/m.11027 type:complete len:290 (+) Transcript_3077:1759-2628(+)
MRAAAEVRPALLWCEAVVDADITEHGLDEAKPVRSLTRQPGSKDVAVLRLALHRRQPARDGRVAVGEVLAHRVAVWLRPGRLALHSSRVVAAERAVAVRQKRVRAVVLDVVAVAVRLLEAERGDGRRARRVVARRDEEAPELAASVGRQRERALVVPGLADVERSDRRPRSVVVRHLDLEVARRLTGAERVDDHGVDSRAGVGVERDPDRPRPASAASVPPAGAGRVDVGEGAGGVAAAGVDGLEVRRVEEAVADLEAGLGARGVDRACDDDEGDDERRGRDGGGKRPR